MSLFKLSTLLVITWCWWLSLAMTGCPNEGFKMVARYKQGFKLNSGDASPYKRYWIAFGSKGQWVINLVDSKIENEHDLHYACNEKYFAFSAIIKENNPPICCAAPHSIDQSIQHQPRPVQHEPAQPTQSHAFAVLPHEYYTALHSKTPLTQKVPPEDQWPWPETFVWMQKIKRAPKKPFLPTGPVTASMLWPMKMTVEQYTDRTTIWNLQVPFATKEGPDTSECIVNAQWLQCDTAITNDIVVFHLVCDEYSLIRFGFSSNGIFKILGFLDCNNAAKREASTSRIAAQKILFYPISKLYPESQHVPSYSSIELGWKLGAFCGSCPSISFTMKVSEQEAQSNKERLQHALASTLTLSSIPVSVKYTRTWYKESAVTLASGRATTITASCNGLDLWYWSVRVGTWGEGNTVIPTQFFYCTDRPTPPICKPRITAEMDATAYGRLCSGQDKDSDFDLAKAQDTDQSPAWQTPHGGRPRPLRLQGQRGNEGALKVVQSDINHIMPRSHLKRAESSLIRANPVPVQQANGPIPLIRSNSAVGSAQQANGPNPPIQSNPDAHIDYIDIWNGEELHDKGLFLARVTYGVDDLSQIGYDDDDDSDSVAQNAYIPYYSVYNGDFQSTANNTDVFIPFFIVLCVLCALCIVVIACICVVGCFVFSKHTSIQKHTNRLNEVTSYEV
eukprot:1162052_1